MKRADVRQQTPGSKGPGQPSSSLPMTDDETAAAERTARRTATRRRLRRVGWKSLGVTLLALCFSMLLASPMTASLSSIFSQPERGDFRITDLYAQVADGRPVRQFDDRIVMLDIGIAGRREIAECLEILAFCQPKAIGIDINFRQHDDNDTILLAALANLPNVVLPLGVEETDSDRFAISDRPFFYGRETGDSRYGVINLPAEKRYASIREYAINYPMATGDTLPSFVTALAAIGDPQALTKARSHGDTYGIIDYPSREFKTIHIEEMADRLEEFNDRYVIVGAVNDAADIHATPVNSHMSGMEIHTYALSTILDGKWMKAMPRWVDYLLAGVLCFLIIFGALWFTGKMRGLALRFAQLSCLMISVWAGYVLFLDKALICDFSITILMLALGLLALDVWNGVEGGIEGGLKKYKQIKQRLCDSNC